MHVTARRHDGNRHRPRHRPARDLRREAGRDAPAGARLTSDPVKLDVAPDSDLVVSLYLPERAEVSTIHRYATQVNAVAAVPLRLFAAVDGRPAVSR
ncbi:hypothetical protein ACFWYW_22990 [Nonomuraea sp. NPDC059023]|uniref:hypothetical protein n=1 Tax=unclassified Nonomuraea TaxID=2593643 RepID=UPI003675538D